MNFWMDRWIDSNTRYTLAIFELRMLSRASAGTGITN